jgi:hypothetical protein
MIPTPCNFDVFGAHGSNIRRAAPTTWYRHVHLSSGKNPFHRKKPATRPVSPFFPMKTGVSGTKLMKMVATIEKKTRMTDKMTAFALTKLLMVYFIYGSDHEKPSTNGSESISDAPNGKGPQSSVLVAG